MNHFFNQVKTSKNPSDLFSREELDMLIISGIRMVTGLERQNYANCEWYEGIESDGVEEFKMFLEGRNP